MRVVRHDGHPLNCKAVFLRYLQPVIAEHPSKSRAEDTSAIAGSEDQVVVQLEGGMRNRQTHRLFGSITEDGRLHSLIIAVMLRLLIQILFDNRKRRLSNAVRQITARPQRRSQSQLLITFA